MSASTTPKSAFRQNRAPQKPSTQPASTKFSSALFAAVTLLLAATAWGQGKILYSFSGPPDGLSPVGGLVRDAAGNLYGATPAGGNTSAEQCTDPTNGCGVVFELTNSGGTWTESIIHTFVPGSGDGINPYGNLIIDSAGNLYGTTEFGGLSCSGFFCGVGTVYKLSPAGGGLWTETILYNFQAPGDGIYPEAGLTMDSAGNLYGTTGFGGNTTICNTLGCGTVFELSPGSGGTWTEHILYTFEDGADGGEPGSGVVFDKTGNLYGTGAVGGDVTCNPPYGCGLVYELSPSGGGSWTETAIHNFENNIGGSFPSTGVAIDNLGNLYGNMLGGANGDGYAYKMSPQTGGGFKFTSLYSFDGTHGSEPYGTPMVAGGIVYGPLLDGGGDNASCTQGCGGIYRLAPSGSGVGFSFLGFGTSPKGANPKGSLMQDPSGNLYGTTTFGGAHGDGTVFEVTP
jgi:uncharacterized repeat protein (TIGR03803 family)